MINCKTKRWGNSLGIIIPKEEARRLGLEEGQEITVDILKKENPLKELFGAGKRSKVSLRGFKENRKLLESKWI